ncbi:MAG: DNA topoisomerase III [Verrucomicrobia bacterium]|nr:DNA topoisomerase III [Verrucomicrobiota bacterium]
MGKALIIAEKPSVAGDIAKALGGFKKAEDFYESDRFVLSSAVGHLLELTPPEGVEAAKGKWTFKCLPVIPPYFDLQPIEKTENRLRVLSKLIKRKDVDALINACDAGREGELIFRNIVKYTKAQHPIQRLWLQSMTPAAIREGFEALRDDPTMLPLADAAFSRAEADWLVGINGTRAMTAFNSKSGGFYKTTVGRVQTPTLAILVEREQKIRKFVSREYWEVIATFDAAAGQYPGRWFDEKFAKQEGKDADAELKPERFWERPQAEAIRDKCLGKPGIVTEESKPSTQLSPLLYDLTSLQREANSRFGLPASKTLAVAQALYEKHKVLTYPRTDSRALPEDYLATVRSVLHTLEGTSYGPFSKTILDHGWVKPNKRVFNNAKVSDHFAIIPTTQAPKGLSELEQKLYDMVTKRFLAVFYPAAEFLETTRITRVEGEPFKSVGKVLVSAGWLTVYGKEAVEEDTPSLVPVQPNERVNTSAIDVKQSQTKPPPRFTEATLLSAMEGAGKMVEDDELREAMRDKGLGTPATRASIIEGLVYEQYVHRNGRELQATAKAFMLMELLNGLGIPELTKPELTGDWEFSLRQIQRKQKSRAEFMAEIAEATRRIVDRAKQYEYDTIPGDFGVLTAPCPKCGGEVHEKYKAFQCVNGTCGFSMWKIMSGRMIEPAEAETLIREKQIGPLQGFRSKMGKPFAAVLKLNLEFKVEYDFGDDKKPENGEAAAEVDFTGKEPLGKCPKCGARVFENGMTYVCEKSVGAAKQCTFRTGAVILQQKVEPAQIQKLLEAGKTDLLKDFVSKKTGRKFEAFLVLKDGEVKFEFAPRKSKFPPKGAKPKEPPPKLDFTGMEPVGACPKCGGRVFEGPESFLCEQSQAEKKPCKFKAGKLILQQPLEREQVKKLLSTGKTDLLTQFVSGKTGRPFSAYLVLTEDDKVGFEFPPREEK